MTLSLSGTAKSAVGTGTTCTLAVPATPQFGDALCAMIAVDTVVAFTKPGAFTLIGTQADTNTGNDQIIGAWWRPCDGTEAASFPWLFASNAFAGGMVLIHSDIGSVVLDTFNPSQGVASTANVINSGLTTSQANEMIVGGFAIDISPAGAVTYTPPGTMNEQIDVNSGTWAAIELCTELFAGPGATGSRTAVGSISTGIGTISILAAFKEVLAAGIQLDEDAGWIMISRPA